MNDRNQNIDIFIAFYGGEKTGTLLQAKELYDQINGMLLPNGKRLQAYCHPSCNEFANFSDTPRLVAISKLFILLVDKNIPKNSHGQILEKNADGEDKYLYKEIAAFRESSSYKKNNSNAKMLICDDMDFHEANILDPMFSGNIIFTKQDPRYLEQIKNWIVQSFLAETNINNDNALKHLPLYIELSKRPNFYFYKEKIEKAYDICDNNLKKIEQFYLNEIDYSINHSLRMIKSIGDVLANDLSKLSTIEIVIIIMSALFHDIGMLVFEEDEEELEKNDYILNINTSLRLSNITKNLCSGDQRKAKEYIFKKTKFQRIRKNLERLNCEDLFVGANGKSSYLEEMISICAYKNKRFDEIVTNFRYDNLINGENFDKVFVSCLIYFADSLDFDINKNIESSLDFLFEYDCLKGVKLLPQMIINNPVNKIRRCEVSSSSECINCKHNNNEVFIQVLSYDELKNRTRIDFTIEDYDDIQRRIIEYKDHIENVIKTCKYVLKENHSKYVLHISDNVVYRGDNSRIPNHKIDIDYNTTVSLLLGEQIYGDRRVGLREIVQNSIDACKFRLAKNRKKIGYTPNIWIEIDKNENQIRINDNGIGMNRYILENFFLKIGKSLYSSETFKESSLSFKHSGHYGIGFFATFMLSNNVEIITRHVDEQDTWNVRVSTKSRYASISKAIESREPGTTIILNYADFEKNFNVYNLESYDLYNDVKFFLAKYFLADLDNVNKIAIYIIDASSESDKSELIPIESLSNKLGDTKNVKTVDLSKYLSDISCLIHINERETNGWYVYQKDKNGEKFVKANLDIFKKTKTFIYKKIFSKTSNVYIYIPDEFLEIDPETNEKIHPFDYDGIDRQSAFQASTEKVYGNITIKDLYNMLGWDLPDFSQPIMGYIGRYYVSIIDSKITFYQKDVAVASREPSHAITLNGTQYRDSIYVRNVFIPEFHIQLPLMVNMVDEQMLPEIKKLVVNIEKEGVFPKIDRNDMPSKIKEEISQAIGIAVFKWLGETLELPALFNKFIKDEYGNVNNRFVVVDDDR